MNFFQRLFSSEKRSPLDNPSVSLANPAIWSWLTSGEPTASGELISEGNSLQIITVYSCVRVLAESVASLPLKLYERLPNGRQEATDQDLYELLTIQPNPEMTAFSFFETLVGSLALTGNAYAQIQRSGSKVTGLWPLHPLKTSPVRINGQLMYETSDGGPKPRLIQPEDMLAIPLFSFDGLKGLSPIQLARQDLGLHRAATKFGARFFGNGARPGGVLSTATNLNEKQQADVKASWQQSLTGENAHKTAVLWGDWKYESIGLSPEDSQFLATRQFQRSEIAALFRVPPHMVGDTTRLSNNNHEQQSLSFVTDTLKPYTSRIEQECHRKLLPDAGRNANKFFVSFDLRERLKADFATTAQGYALGRINGWYSANKILEDLGENPIGPQGDVILAPVNMVNLKTLIDPSSNSEGSGSVPSGAERSLLSDHAHVLIRVFRDGMGRLLAREKRDCDAVSAIFRPVLVTLIDLAQGQVGTLDEDASERLIREVVKTIEKRAASWTPEQADDLSGPEFLRLVRNITANVGRETGAILALKHLEEGSASK